MHSPNKNSYLQIRTDVQGINPRLINRCVQRARDHKSITEHDLEPPFKRLLSNQPTIPVQNVDLTRRPQAFGRWALPKLRRELHHKDPQVVVAALMSLCDLVHDPEKAFEAIRLKIIDRVVDLVMELKQPEPSIRENAYLFLKILAQQADGKETIVANIQLLECFMLGLEDTAAEVRMKLAACLEEVANYWRTADVLVEMGFIEVLLNSMMDDETPLVIMYLKILKGLMYGEGKNIAIFNEGFPNFVALLNSGEPEILAETCECLMLLTSTRKGKRLAAKSKLLLKMNRLIHCDIPEVYSNAISVIMFCTVKTKQKIVASEIEGMAKRLVELTKGRFDTTTQIYGMKALTNMCEHPNVRNEIKTKYYKEVTSIPVDADPCLKSFKDILMTVIGWAPWDEL